MTTAFTYEHELELLQVCNGSWDAPPQLVASQVENAAPITASTKTVVRTRDSLLHIGSRIAGGNAHQTSEVTQCIWQAALQVAFSENDLPAAVQQGKPRASRICFTNSVILASKQGTYLTQ